MNLSEKRTKMSKIIITETRLESVKYFYEYEGTIEQAKKWFVDNGNYANVECEVENSELLTVDYKESEDE
jgi:hypothetical protein